MAWPQPQKKKFGKGVVMALGVLVLIITLSTVYVYTTLQGQIIACNTDKSNLQIQARLLQSQLNTLNTTYQNYVSTHSHTNSEYNSLLELIYITQTETAMKMNSIYSRTVGILDFMSDDMKELVDRNITATIFSTRMDDLKGDMLAVRADLTELKKVAFSTYVESINLLDLGLQAYSDAIDYAHDLNFNQTSIYLEQGTDFVNRSKVALPQP